MSVALSGGTVLVGTTGSTGLAGAVYAFTPSGGNLALTAVMSPSSQFDSAGFCNGIAASGSTLIGGASSNGPGVAHVFTFGAADGDGCTSAAACVSGHCVERGLLHGRLLPDRRAVQRAGALPAGYGPVLEHADPRGHGVRRPRRLHQPRHVPGRRMHRAPHHRLRSGGRLPRVRRLRSVDRPVLDPGEAGRDPVRRGDLPGRRLRRAQSTERRRQGLRLRRGGRRACGWGAALGARAGDAPPAAPPRAPLTSRSVAMHGRKAPTAVLALLALAACSQKRAASRAPPWTPGVRRQLPRRLHGAGSLHLPGRRRRTGVPRDALGPRLRRGAGPARRGGARDSRGSHRLRPPRARRVVRARDAGRGAGLHASRASRVSARRREGRGDRARRRARGGRGRGRARGEAPGRRRQERAPLRGPPRDRRRRAGAFFIHRAARRGARDPLRRYGTQRIPWWSIPRCG